MKQILYDELEKLIDIKERRYQIKEYDLELLTTFFNSYYGGKSADRKETDILHTGIDGLLEDKSEFIINILEGLKSYPNDKCKLSERLEKLLIYLKDKYALKFDLNTFENFKIKDKNTRLLKCLNICMLAERLEAK